MKTPLKLLMSMFIIATLTILAIKNNKSNDSVSKIEKVASESSPLNLTVKAEKPQLLGVLDPKTGLRIDLVTWINSLKMTTEEQNLVFNVALAEQHVFSVYDNKDSATKLNTFQNERTACLALKLKDTKKFAILLGEIRSRIFNSNDRVNSFHLYSRVKEQLPINRGELQKTCSILSKGKVELIVK